MPMIWNKLDQRLIINLKSGKNIDLFAKSTADVSEDDLSSLHVQKLISNGSIIVSSEKERRKERRSSERKSSEN